MSIPLRLGHDFGIIRQYLSEGASASPGSTVGRIARRRRPAIKVAACGRDNIVNQCTI